MPRIVRPMYFEADGLPEIGSRSKCLGVREPPDCNADIDLDGTRDVRRNRKGLSVSEGWRDLPGHLIPNHLNDGFNGAVGKKIRVFVHGTGRFSEEAVAEGLELLHKSGTITAGVVAPSASVPIAEYQQLLAATRRAWTIDES